MSAGLASNGIARYKACRIGEMDILFVTATRIGDAVLSTGLISYLIDRYPGARLTIAAGPVAAPLFDAVPGLERLVVVEKQRWSLALVAALCRGRGALLGPCRRFARLGARLAAASGRAQGNGQGRCGRTSGATARPPIRSRSAAGTAAVDGARSRTRRCRAGSRRWSGAGDRPDCKLARQTVARGTFCRAGADG